MFLIFEPMQFSVRHIAFIIGIILVTFSFLFFGRQHLRYINWLTGGIFISFIAFVIILIRDKIRSKLIWSGIVAVAILIHYLTEPVFIRQSYKLLLRKDEILLTDVNEILVAKPDAEYLILKSDSTNKYGFTNEEKGKIDKLFQKTPIVIIEKDHSRIYYVTFKMLDVQNGIAYYFSADKPVKNHLAGNWYY